MILSCVRLHFPASFPSSVSSAGPARSLKHGSNGKGSVRSLKLIWPVALLGLSVFTTATVVASTVYENGDRGNTSGWAIAANGSGKARIDNVLDRQTGNRFIAFTGTLRDAFLTGSGSRRWGNVDEQIVSWKMRTANPFQVYVVLYTDRGRRTIRYQNSAMSKLIYRPGYIDHGLGDSAADGSWQTHVRDLQADLTAAEPGNRIVAVNSFMFRGQAYMDDLSLHATVAEAGGGSSPAPTPAPAPAPAPEPEPVPAPAPAPVPAPAPAAEPEPKPKYVENGKRLAFPGAEGHGRFARGGRNGRIVIVDTLADKVANDGVTSLREALEVMKGPRTIVFAVGGTFDLGKRNLLMNGNDDSYVTLACQSAPAPGVLIRGAGIRIRGGAHNIVMRHCAIRNIDPGAPASESSRTIAVIGGSRAGNDLIFDNMSLGWATDEGFTAFVSPTAKADLRNITLSRSIVAEGDADSTHPESGQLPRRYLHSMGPSCASSSSRYRMVGCSIIGNLIAHNGRRNPLVWGMSGEVANNVMYNWQETALDARPHKPGRLDLHIWGNFFKAGANMKIGGRPPMVLINEPGKTHLRVSDNTFMTQTSSATRRLETVSLGSPAIKRNAISEFRLACVGATRPARDPWDERIITEYRSGSGQVGIGQNHTRDYPSRSRTRHPASHDTDRDGMADDWELAHGLDPNDSGDHRTISRRTGFTAIEMYLSDIGEC